MPISILFWVIYVVALIFSVGVNWPLNRSTASGLVLFVLLFLLGWRVFGFVITN